MESSHIAELLKPFLAEPLADSQLAAISTYMDLLLRWNARINLTSVRDEESIVTRHFGESLFLAAHLFPAGRLRSAAQTLRLIDVGSGAGFPGLPTKLWHPDLQLTLIESNHRKATFLREVVRALALRQVDVFIGRAEDYKEPLAEVLTLRAVERFESVLPVAARLVASGGQLALLVGEPQAPRASSLIPDFAWAKPIPVPGSVSRILLLGSRSGVQNLCSNESNPLTGGKSRQN